MAVPLEERKTGECNVVSWNTKPVTHPQISKDDIDFQKCHEGLEALKQNERERLYPPNFLIGAVRISADAKPTVLRIEVYVVGGSVRFSIDVAVPLMQGVL